MAACPRARPTATRHSTPARQPWDRPGRGGGGQGDSTSPQTLGSPPRARPNPRSSPGPRSHHPPCPNPKAHSSAVGDASHPPPSPNPLIEHQNLCPALLRPPLAACWVSPPIPGPSNAWVPPVSRTPGTAGRGVHGSVGQQPAGQGPLPAPGPLRARMFSPSPGMWPISPSHPPQSPPRASLGTPPSMLTPGGGEAAGGKSPRRREVSAPYVLHGLFSATSSTNSHDHPKSTPPPPAPPCKHRATSTMPRVPETYLQTEVKTRWERSASDINSQH